MSRAASWTVIALVLTFLIGPFLVIVGAALSAGSIMAFPPEGLSLQWFAKVFSIDSFRTSFAISIFLGLGSPLAALILGVPAAYAMARYPVPGAELVRLLVSAPIIVPGIIVGLALCATSSFPPASASWRRCSWHTPPSSCPTRCASSRPRSTTCAATSRRQR